MTRFIYLSDTHIGTTPIAFQQQPAYPEHMAELLDALNAWIERDGGIDFIVHGGDMLNEVSRDHIRRASALFDRFSIPIYLCLGNHDLTEPDALSWWLSEAPQFFIDGEPTFVIEHDDSRICIMPNHWDTTPWYWTEQQRPHFTPEQHAWVRNLAIGIDTPTRNIFITHSPVHAVPTGQTGFPEPFHAPLASFGAEVLEIATSSFRPQCVVGAHSHINSCTVHDGLSYVTVSSFAEAPFEFKVFEIDDDSVQMSTHNLAQAIDFRWRYDFDKTYVQGRHCDRAFRRSADEDPAIQHS